MLKSNYYMNILFDILAILISKFMSQSFKVKVNEFHDFSFSEEEIKSLNLVEKTKKNYHILKENQSFNVEVVESSFDEKKYTVQVNGNSYQINISNELDILITELGLEASTTKKINDLKAPMPGLIVSVDIKEGQKVQEGDGILVLEAMKMENTLLAPKDGMVKAITIKVGDKVEKNQLLIEME